MCIKGLRRGLPLWPTRYKLQARSLLIIFPSPQLVSSIKRLCTCQIPLLPQQCSATVLQVQALLCTTAPPIHYKCLPKQGRQGHRFPESPFWQIKNGIWMASTTKNSDDHVKTKWFDKICLSRIHSSLSRWHFVQVCKYWKQIRFLRNLPWGGSVAFQSLISVYK